MTTNIQHLADQAKKSIPHGIHSPDKWIEEYNKKFAELIVRECMSVVSRKCASPTAYEALAEHFGVGE